MPATVPITPGKVDWTGENPGIILKNDDDSFAAMSLFFRVSWSPVGPGQLLLLYASPDDANGTPDAPNVMIGDNPELAEFLHRNFIGKLAAFREAAPYDSLKFMNATSVEQSGDPMGHRYTELIASREHMIALVWEDLQKPVALELTPELTGTGEHVMYTVLVPAHAASIHVNGRKLEGRLGTRVQAGIETTTAFLYFSETWIIPPDTPS